MNDIWRKIDVIVSPHPVLSELYCVEFRPRELTQKRAPAGESPHVPKNLVLTVEDRGDLHITSFSHATNPILYLDHMDYELKAILAVSEYRLHHP